MGTESKMTTIRMGTPSDAARCATIAEAAYLPYVADIGRRPMPMDQDFEECSHKSQLWVLEADDVVGYVIAFPQGTAWLLENIAIDPSLQGKGYGRLLVAHVEALAKASGGDKSRIGSPCERMTVAW